MTTLRAHLETLRRAQRAALQAARHAQDFAHTHPGHQEDDTQCPMCGTAGTKAGPVGRYMPLRCSHCSWRWDAPVEVLQ